LLNSNSQQPLLEYAGFAERAGIITETIEGGIRLLIPPPAWKRRLHVGGLIAVGVYCAYVFLIATGHFYLIRSGRLGSFLAEVGPSLIIPTIVAVGVLASVRSLGERLIKLEVNRTHILIDAPVMDWEKPGPRWQQLKFERQRATSVKGHLPGMGLTIRIEDAELFELMHQYPLSTRIWVANMLLNALGLPEDLSQPERAKFDPPR